MMEDMFIDLGLALLEEFNENDTEINLEWNEDGGVKFIQIFNKETGESVYIRRYDVPLTTLEFLGVKWEDRLEYEYSVVFSRAKTLLKPYIQNRKVSIIGISKSLDTVEIDGMDYIVFKAGRIYIAVEKTKRVKKYLEKGRKHIDITINLRESAVTFYVEIGKQIVASGRDRISSKRLIIAESMDELIDKIMEVRVHDIVS